MTLFEQESIKESCEELSDFLYNSLSRWDGTENNLKVIENAFIQTLKTEFNGAVSSFSNQNDIRYVRERFCEVESQFKAEMCNIYSQHEKWNDSAAVQVCYMCANLI